MQGIYVFVGLKDTSQLVMAFVAVFNTTLFFSETWSVHGLTRVLYNITSQLACFFSHRHQKSYHNTLK